MGMSLIATEARHIMNQVRMWPQIFVETGTFRGQTVINVRHLFQEIHTVELSVSAYEFCKKRCFGIEHIKLYCGDSAIWMQDIAKRIEGPAFFYLDAHYFLYGKFQHLIATESKMPLLAELAAIKIRDFNDLVVIDDYKWLGKKGAGVDWQDCAVDKILDLMKPQGYDIWKDYLIFRTKGIPFL